MKAKRILGISAGSTVTGGKEVEIRPRPVALELLQDLAPIDDSFASQWSEASDKFLEKLARGRQNDPWTRARFIERALRQLSSERHQPDFKARGTLVREVERHVPGLRPLNDARALDAKHLVDIVIAGNGALGIKTLNDELVGFEFNANWLVPRQQAILQDVFENGLPLEPGEQMLVSGQTYKKTTITTNIEDPERVRTLIECGLEIFDQRMLLLLNRAFLRASGRWRLAGKAAAGTPQAPETQRRIKNLRAARKALPDNADDWRYPVQYGIAKIKRLTHTGLLEADLRATKAARMAWATDDVDRRGMQFNLDAFWELVAAAKALRAEINDAGNIVCVNGIKHPVFVEDEGMPLPNPHLVRELRKGRLQADKISADDREILGQLSRYLKQVNVLDFFKRFSTADLKCDLPDRVGTAIDLIRRLSTGKPVASEDLMHFFRHDCRGQEVSELDTASEITFFNEVVKRTNRIVLHVDIIDFGLKLMRGCARSINSMTRDDTDTRKLFKLSLAATDSVMELRRDGLDMVRAVYEKYRTRLIEEKSARDVSEDDDAVVAKLENTEATPLMLLGGDEITLSIHACFQPYVADMANEIATQLGARVGVSWAEGDAEQPKHAQRSHRQAFAAADHAASIAKHFESCHRRLMGLAGLVRDESSRASGTEKVAALHLRELFAEVDLQGGVTVRRFGSGEPVADIDVQIEAARDFIDSVLDGERPPTA